MTLMRIGNQKVTVNNKIRAAQKKFMLGPVK